MIITINFINISYLTSLQFLFLVLRTFYSQPLSNIQYNINYSHYAVHWASQMVLVVILACRCRRRKRHGFDPWVRKISWRKERLPTLVFLPEKFHGVGCSPWDHKESIMTEHTCGTLHLQNLSSFDRFLSFDCLYPCHIHTHACTYTLPPLATTNLFCIRFFRFHIEL